MKLVPRLIAAALLGGSALIAAPAQAQLNNPPPAGSLVLDLASQPLPTAYTFYDASFTALQASSVLTFAFRNDPGHFEFDDVTMTDNNGSATNLLGNPGFNMAGPTTGTKARPAAMTVSTRPWPPPSATPTASASTLTR